MEVVFLLVEEEPPTGRTKVAAEAGGVELDGAGRELGETPAPWMIGARSGSTTIAAARLLS